MSKAKSLYSFINDPTSKRRDLLNLAIGNIELIKRGDNIKVLRDQKMMALDTLRKEIEMTKKTLRHLESIMPFKVKEKEERIVEKVHKRKIVHQQKVKVEKISGLDFELENIKDKLNRLNF